jgi:hypothetical protein
VVLFVCSGSEDDALGSHLHVKLLEGTPARAMWSALDKQS